MVSASRKSTHTVQSTLYYSQLLAEVRAVTAGRSGPLTGNLVSTNRDNVTAHNLHTYMNSTKQATWGCCTQSSICRVTTTSHSLNSSTAAALVHPHKRPTQRRRKKEKMQHTVLSVHALDMPGQQSSTHKRSVDTAHTKREKVQHTLLFVHTHYAAGQPAQAPCTLSTAPHNHHTSMHTHMPDSM
jgi:hypothetical protein